MQASERVYLTHLQIHPIERDIRSGREAEFNANIIQIKGEAPDINNYKEFLNRIHSIDFIREIRAKSYKYDLKKQLGVFSIEIIYNDK